MAQRKENRRVFGAGSVCRLDDPVVLDATHDFLRQSDTVVDVSIRGRSQHRTLIPVLPV